MLSAMAKQLTRQSLNPHLREMFDWRSLAVLRRNTRVFLRNWKTAFLPPALEPVVQMLAFGIGLGAYVGAMQWHGNNVDYPSYMAPGILAQTCFYTSFFEGLYSAYVRMFYQKTWDGILATQVELHHIVWGEVLWASLRGFMNGVVVAVVIGVLHLLGVVHVHWGWLPLLPFVGIISGWAFGAFALIFTALVPSIDHMNYPVFLVGLPLGLVSNTFFPLTPKNPLLAAIAQCNPIYQLAETFRSMLLGGAPDLHWVWLGLSSLVMLVICSAFAQKFVAKRMLGE